MQTLFRRQWLGGMVLIALFGMGTTWAQAVSVPPAGFTADTHITVVLDHEQIYRYLYESEGPGDKEHGWIRLTSGHGTQSSNKIMLYGDRTGALYEGENDWQMTPRPINLYLQGTNTALETWFDFGPACLPPDLEEWDQVYRYTAAGNLDNGGSTSGSDNLHVISLLPRNSCITIDDADTY